MSDFSENVYWRGILLIQKAFKIFLEQKDFYGFWMDFFWKQTDFSKSIYEIFQSDMPLMFACGNFTLLLGFGPLQINWELASSKGSWSKPKGNPHFQLIVL